MTTLRSRSPTTPAPVSRPTTPIRPSSRSSIHRGSFSHSHSHSHDPINPIHHLDIQSLEPQIAELSDSLSTLEANFQHLQLIHESLSRFTESFASMLYGLNMNAFVTDFSEAPTLESVQRRARKQKEFGGSVGADGDDTVLGQNLGDVTEVSNASMRATPRRKSVMPGQRQQPVTPGTTSSSTAGNTTIRLGNERKSGVPAARGVAAAGRGVRGARGGAAGETRGSGLPRGRGWGIGRGVR